MISSAPLPVLRVYLLISAIFFMGLMCLMPFVSHAAANEAGDMQVVGTSHYSKWGFSVYDAVLKAPGGKYAADKPFSLTLTYKLSLNGAQIADQSRKEIARQKVPAAQLDAWSKQLAGLIPNVAKGDTLTGVRTDKGTMTLTKNGKLLGEITDPGLTKAFFDIWLGNNTSEPSQKAHLLGQGQA